MTKYRRSIAIVLLVVMLGDLVVPATAYALSSGPSQPEVQGFQPASAGDMVNLFTGDCSYNIPLLDVEGYPVNLFYNAGVSMDQEASWVGLGWNLNPGTVDRNLRGVPDDFKGDAIERTMNLRTNRTYGVSYAADLLVFSVPVAGSLTESMDIGGLSMSLAPSYNNYNGWQFDLGMNFSMRSTAPGKAAFTGGLGMTSSSNGGLRLKPSIGFDMKQQDDKHRNSTAGLNFGLALDSRAGLTGMSFGASVRASRQVLAGPSMPGSDYGKVKQGGGVSTSYSFGAPSYSPQILLPMSNTSVSFSFTAGPAFQGGHPNMTLGGSYSQQKLISPSRSTPAYGYLHLDAGERLDEAQLDFNREKDGGYSGDRPALGIATLTNDFFTVSGQGVSGSYRPYRSEVGHVYDPVNGSHGSGGSFGLDLGAGLLAHGGAKFSVNSSSSTSQRWNLNTNDAGQRLLYRDLESRPDLEKVYFREANEATVQQDPALWNAMHQDKAVQFTIPSNGTFDNRLGAQLTGAGVGTTPLPGVNYRQKREPRKQLFTYLDHSMAQRFAVDEPFEHPNVAVKGHHINEITVLNDQGGRYVYGLPAYNIFQVDVEFNTDSSPGSDDNVEYSTTDASTSNSSGKERFYSRTTTPAYAYAWLLTSILSNDYSDVDGQRGPSDGDLGTYTAFKYDRVCSAMPWRTPSTGGMHARYIENAPSVGHDDKATYSYGTKEVQVLKQIVTKNRIAVFHTSDRQDGFGANELGALQTQDGNRLQRLDSISLYDKSTYNGDTPGPPLKRVHFEYNSELCLNTPNSNAPGDGKLTLKKVWFTYGTSRMGRTSPYVFSYATANPDYNALNQDRWGNYRVPSASIPNKVYPYAEQEDAKADEEASAWNLTAVKLPTGGTISIHYEADDYAFVQDRRAMRMTKILGINNTYQSWTPDNNIKEGENRYLWFDLPDGPLPGISSDPAEAMVQMKERFFGGIDELYFRMFVKMQGNIPDKYDAVSGYARIDDGPDAKGIILQGGTDRVGYIRLANVQLDEGQGAANANPLYRSALEYLQITYPDQIGSTVDGGLSDNQDVTRGFLMSIVGSVAGIISGAVDFFQGPNQEVGSRFQAYCRSVDLSRSWIRLNEPDQSKNGGGHRVRLIEFNDEWAAMETTEDSKEYTYSTRYTYGDVLGSWGVAAYEPMSGADENPFRQPVYTTIERALTPDQRFYLEEPFGEAMFPSPVVGYSRVEVASVVPESVSQAIHGTGRVVHEFYTAMDFPTIVARTGISPNGRRANDANLLSLLGFKKIDHMHASQGFVVETNDMHGKPKQVSVYAEGGTEAISYVRYNYGQAPYGQHYKVVNTETVIDPQGQVGQAEIGVDHEFLADTRETISRCMSGGADVKFELLYAFVAAIPVPLCLPQVSWESTRYKTGVLVKKVHRFGRLRETVKMENGSVVSTENLAYDAITGDVLVTRTANDFKDPVYSMTFPAYWHYKDMGPAYQNIGAKVNVTVVNGEFNHASAQQLFVPGDELALRIGTVDVRAWVDGVSGNTVRVILYDAAPVANGAYIATVIRSGRRNMQGALMMTVTSLTNPLNGLNGNAYANLINAYAVEYGGQWETDCACFPDDGGLVNPNPWVLNQKGVWRLQKENAWLTERTRSTTNGNSNIRRDGVYSSFDAFYKVINGQWIKDITGWTSTREVTHYSNRGQELENKDALGLYSSALFGYGGSLAKAVARNARYCEMGFDGFEERMDPVDCTDQHFRFMEGVVLVSGVAHTGRNSVRVTASDSVSIHVEPVACQEDECKGLAEIQNGRIHAFSTNGPVQLEVEILDGEVTLTPYSASLWTPDPPTGWTIRVRVTDAVGCSETHVLSSPTTP